MWPEKDIKQIDFTGCAYVCLSNPLMVQELESASSAQLGNLWPPFAVVKVS